jgi:hypothetical protein
MTDQLFPITPPPELVEQWFLAAKAMPVNQWVTDVANQAARWGADQELEACCEWLKAKEWIHPEFSDELHTARRPKPPSLKEQALAILDDVHRSDLGDNEMAIIRRALEQLDD